MIKKIKSFVKNMLMSIHYLAFRFSFLSTESIPSKADRLAFDSFVSNKLKKQLKLKSALPSVAVVYRVKNGAEYIEASILSVSPFAKKIIVVDNGSSDNTVKIVEVLSQKLSGITEIILNKYDGNLCIAGEGYLDKVKKNKCGSLAGFYNYCFSLADCDYVMKFDAHCILSPYGIDSLQKAISKGFEGIIFRGVEIYGKWLNSEMYLYKSNLGFIYVDDEFYEKLKWNEEIRTKKLLKPIFMHIKRISYIKYLGGNDSPILRKYN